MFKQKTQFAMAFAVLLSVTACGGGDGGGGNTDIAATPTPAPVTPDATPKSDAETQPKTPVLPEVPTTPITPITPMVGETLPSNSQPQPGSMTDVGNGLEGVWYSVTSIALIDDHGNLYYSPTVGAIFGGIDQTSSNTWAFRDGTVNLFVGATPVTGSGSFEAKKTLSSTSYSGSTEIKLSYSFVNALAVNADSLTGNWGKNGSAIEFTIATDGSFSGSTAGATFGSCQVQGKLEQTHPDSAKNLYNITLTANGSSVCKLATGVPHSGLAAIRFSNTGSVMKPVYQRTLLFIARTSGNGYIVAEALRPS